MRRNTAGNSAFMIVLVLVFLACSILASNKTSSIRNNDPQLSPRLVHAPIAGFETVVADVMWIRLVQYIGSYYSSDYDRTVWADSLYQRFDRLTSLDPCFTTVYYYGVLLLSVESPDNALRLLDRGIRYIPSDEMDWQLPFYGAYISYQYSDDDQRYNKGIEYIDIVTKFRECPSFIPRFKALVQEKQGTPNGMLDVWYSLYKESEPPDQFIIKGHLMSLANNILRGSNDELKTRAKNILKEVTGSEEMPAGYFDD